MHHFVVDGLEFRDREHLKDLEQRMFSSCWDHPRKNVDYAQVLRDEIERGRRRMRYPKPTTHFVTPTVFKLMVDEGLIDTKGNRIIYDSATV